MNSAANYTIKGFYYQFNKTLYEILNTEDDGVVIPEGLVEDVDVITNDAYKAIQCKYHETSEKYEESVLYQPILEMMLSYYYYSNNNHNNIEYILYIHLADGKDNISIDADFINRMLKSKNKDIITKYICRIFDITDSTIQPLIEKHKRTDDEKKQICDYVIKKNNSLRSKININDFLSKFKLNLGKSYTDLETDVKGLMHSLNMCEEEIDKFFYPNAINEIAEICQKCNPDDRKIIKKQFINQIKEHKNILVTKWTKALYDYGKLLKYKKEQLSNNLQIPTRKRVFIITPPILHGVEYILGNFIVDYIQIYKRKPIQTSIPMFFIDGCTDEFLNTMEKHIFSRGILVNNGKVGNEPNESRLFNLSNYGDNMKLALCKYDAVIKDMILKNPPDDVFIIGRVEKDEFNNSISIEKLDINSLDELAYLLNMRKVV